MVGMVATVLIVVVFPAMALAVTRVANVVLAVIRLVVDRPTAVVVNLSSDYLFVRFAVVPSVVRTAARVRRRRAARAAPGVGLVRGARSAAIPKRVVDDIIAAAAAAAATLTRALTATLTRASTACLA